MLNISARQLEIFVSIVTEGSARAAAEQLHLTQPAVSLALSELERHLGGPLFARVRGRLRLNDRGREIVSLAREVLERMRDLQQRAAGEARELAGNLRLGASNTVGNYLVGELLGRFTREHPQVTVQLHVGNTRGIVAAVRAHAMDVGCVEGPVVHADLEVHPWRRDMLVVCAPQKHPLARKSRLQAADFAGAHWIVREQGSATRAQTERILATLPPGETVLELDQIEAIKQAVIAGLGIACLPAVAVENAARAGRLKVLETPFLDLERRLSLVLDRATYHGALITAFMACTKVAGTA
ncbi:MAG TPA: LysR substrate-binding domain-containing protein [Nevskiaceae bacterium]